MGREAAQALARQLNWEPPDHDDMPGSIPDHAWDHWRRFAEFASREIYWRKVDPASWLAAHGDEWIPQFEATSAGEIIFLIQHDCHGFPDPPEWALYVMAPGLARCLGCFDTWPGTWRGAP